VSWATDKMASSQVDYGTTTAYGSSTPPDAALTEAHLEPVSGLAAATAYHYRVRSTDASGRQSVSSDSTFTTAAPMPAFRSSSTVTNGTTVAAPSGEASGDLLLASLEVDASSVTVTGPAGWTLLTDKLVGSGSSAFHSQLWSHQAGGSEPASYSFKPSTSAWTDIGLLDYQNVDPTSPVDAAAAADAGVTGIPSTPSVTTTRADDMVVALFQDFQNGTWSAGSGMTGRFDFDSNFAEDAIQPAAGATGARTATNSTTGQMASEIVALRARQADTTPPTVAMTSPPAGATVSGAAVGLAASASDDVGVAAVQFTLDGGSLGPRLTSAPYAFTWDSTGVVNGSHTISAQAWDQAGNVATAAAVSITVANQPPPVISSVVAGAITTSGATVTWTTDQPADGQVEYGASTSYGSLTPLDSTMAIGHSEAVTGLAAGTLYHYRVHSRNASGAASVSADATFTTTVSGPPVISQVQAGSITTSGATIGWTTDTPSSSQVEYGTTTAYGSSTTLDSALVTSHAQTLSGLAASTLYHFRVRSTDAFGNQSLSTDATFTAAPASPPSFRSRSSVTNGTTVAKPSGVAAGDLLLASLEVDANPATVTAPAGWTLLQDVLTGSGTGTAFHAQLWYRVAGSSEPASYTWNTGGASWTDIGILDYSNVHSAAPIDVSAGRDAGTTTQPVTNSITTTYGNDLVVAVFIDYANASWTPGAGLTMRFDFDANMAEDGVAVAPGGVGPVTATSSAAGSAAGLVVAVRAP